MLNLETALRNLSSIKNDDVTSESIGLSDSKFLIYLIFESLKKQCQCKNHKFDYLTIDPLLNEPFDNITFDVLVLHDDICVSAYKNERRKLEKRFSNPILGSDPFNVAENIIRWIADKCLNQMWESHNTKRLSRRFERYNELKESFKNGDIKDFFYDKIEEIKKFVQELESTIDHCGDSDYDYSIKSCLSDVYNTSEQIKNNIYAIQHKCEDY